MHFCAEHSWIKQHLKQAQKSEICREKRKLDAFNATFIHDRK